MPVVPYDMSQKSYGANSYICDTSNMRAPFVCFKTTATPFDTGFFVTLNDADEVVGNLRLPVTASKFLLCGREPKKNLSVSEITVSL
jgi:hypothetical protein